MPKKTQAPKGGPKDVQQAIEDVTNPQGSGDRGDPVKVGYSVPVPPPSRKKEKGHGNKK